MVHEIRVMHFLELRSGRLDLAPGRLRKLREVLLGRLLGLRALPDRSPLHLPSPRTILASAAGRKTAGRGNWAAITDPARRAQWFGATSIDPREGGLIETDSDDPPVPKAAKHMSGRILVWDPPHVFEHEWHQPIVRQSVV